MRITKFSDYSLRVLIYLASNPAEQLTTIAELATAYSISVHHVRMVVHKLGLLGYIHSIQGKGGGIELAIDPGEISIGDVVRQTESDFFIVECFSANDSCPIVKVCKLQHIFAEALNAFFESLDQYTLEDITGNKQQIMKKLNVA